MRRQTVSTWPISPRMVPLEVSEIDSQAFAATLLLILGCRLFLSLRRRSYHSPSPSLPPSPSPPSLFLGLPLFAPSPSPLPSLSLSPGTEHASLRASERERERDGETERERGGGMRDLWALRRQHCLASWDSDLEAFSRSPTDGSLSVLACQLATFAKYLNEVSSRADIYYGRCIKLTSRVRLSLTTV